jgi:hypothetical protein
MSDVTEIVYTWPSGREEVRYRRPKGSAGAKKLIDEVECIKARLAGEKCPYSYRDVTHGKS